jgi:hypothetical protein
MKKLDEMCPPILENLKKEQENPPCIQISFGSDAYQRELCQRWKKERQGADVKTKEQFSAQLKAIGYGSFTVTLVVVIFFVRMKDRVISVLPSFGIDEMEALCFFFENMDENDKFLRSAEEKMLVVDFMRFTEARKQFADTHCPKKTLDAAGLSTFSALSDLIKRFFQKEW